MTGPRFGAGDAGPGDSPGPSSFRAGGRRPRRPLAFPGKPLAFPGKPTSPAKAGVGKPARADSSAAASHESGPTSPEPAGARPADDLADVAARVFGDRLPLAIDYARLLVTDGVLRGLIGPHEAPRMWERHLINCAVVSEMVPIGASVTDVGSGAGLPGIVLAVARPDLTVILVEPLARRTAFLSEAVTVLGLATSVTVVRGRAGDVVDGLPAGADVVTARAVAPLDRLAAWCLPLARTGGRLLALKGASAADEIAEHRVSVAQVGGSKPVIRLCGSGLVDPATTVVEIVKERNVVPAAGKPPVRAGSGRDPGGRSGGRGSGRGRTRRG